MFCKNCGKEIADGSSYCLHCGVRQKNIFCRNCGSEIPSEATFCPHCGSKQSDGNALGLLISKVSAAFNPTNEKKGINDGTKPIQTKGQNTPNRSQIGINKINDLKTIHKDALNNKPKIQQTEAQKNIIQATNQNKEAVLQNPNNDKDIDNKSEKKNVSNNSLTNVNKDTSVTKDYNFKHSNNHMEQATPWHTSPSKTEKRTPEENHENKLAYSYKEMPLLQRFCGSIIDKFLIVILFSLTIVAINPRKSGGDLGVYIAMLGANPANYEYIDQANVNGSISNPYDDTPFIGQTRNFDTRMTVIFIATYLLYYLFFELLINGSPGKRWLGGLLRTATGEENDEPGTFFRFAIRALFVLFVVGCLHFELNLNYYVTIIVYWTILDISVIFTHRSLVDFMTGTAYMEKGEIIIPSKQSNVVDKKITEGDVNTSGTKVGESQNSISNKKSHSHLVIMLIIIILCFVTFAAWYYWSKIERKEDIRMCPELVNAAANDNSKLPITLVDGIEFISVTYEDSTYTSLYKIDYNTIPNEKLREFNANHRNSVIATIRASKGMDRENYEKYVEYHITKVDKFVNMETGDTTTISISPKEIDAALKEPISEIVRLEQIIDEQKGMLPTEIDNGFILTSIDIENGNVIMSISVDEDIYDFDIVSKLKNDLKESMINQISANPVLQNFCKIISNAHFGLTYRYYGNQTHLETFVPLASDEIAKLISK